MARILLDRAYDQQYQINAHDAKTSTPLSLVELNPAEDMSHSMERAVMERFLLHKISEKFGLNWIEFNEQPFPVCEMMFKVSAEYTERINNPDGG